MGDAASARGRGCVSERQRGARTWADGWMGLHGRVSTRVYDIGREGGAAYVYVYAYAFVYVYVCACACMCMCGC